MIDSNLRRAFNYHRRDRSHLSRPAHARAQQALVQAREDVQAGRVRYDESPWRKRAGVPAGGKPGDQTRWIERPADVGLRFVGYADDLVSLRHTGWFTDPHQCDMIRGVVYQLPGRDGKARYVAGHDNPDNGAADDGGPAFVDFGTIHESDFLAEQRTARRQIGASYWSADMDRPGYWAEAAHETARKEAAHAADSFAQGEAEKEREWQTAWAAGRDYAEKGEEASELRKEALKILAARRRALKEEPGVTVAMLAATARAHVESIVAKLCQLRRERAELKAGDASNLYFFPSDRLQQAFAEGAGQ